MGRRSSTRRAFCVMLGSVTRKGKELEPYLGVDSMFIFSWAHVFCQIVILWDWDPLWNRSKKRSRQAAGVTQADKKTIASHRLGTLTFKEMCMPEQPVTSSNKSAVLKGELPHVSRDPSFKPNVSSLLLLWVNISYCTSLPT